MMEYETLVGSLLFLQTVILVVIAGLLWLARLEAFLPGIPRHLEQIEENTKYMHSLLERIESNTRRD